MSRSILDTTSYLLSSDKSQFEVLGFLLMNGGDDVFHQNYIVSAALGNESIDTI